MSNQLIFKVFPWKIVWYQKDISSYSTHDAIISKWLDNFAYNYSTDDPYPQFTRIYSTFSESGAKGGTMMLKIIIYQIFVIYNDVVTELKNFWITLLRND